MASLSSDFPKTPPLPSVLAAVLLTLTAVVLTVIVLVIVVNGAEADAHAARTAAIRECVAASKDPSTCAVRWAAFEKEPDAIPPADPAALKMFEADCASATSDASVYACAKAIPTWPNGAPEFDISAAQS